MVTRVAAILLAFMIATAAAGVTVALAVSRPDWSTLSIGLAPEFWLLTFLAAGFTGAVIILPLFLLVVLAESFRLRSVLLYSIGGAAVMVFGYFQSGFAEPADATSTQLPIGHEAAIAAAAGIVFGFVYWILAGRKAGAWRVPRA